MTALVLTAAAASLVVAKPLETTADGKLNIVIDGGTAIKVARPGETVDVKIELVNNTTISSVNAKVSWPEKLQLVKAEYNIINDKDTSVMVNLPDEKDGEPDWSSVKGSYVFNWLTAMREVKGDCTFVTMTFKVADDAAEGEYLAITAEADPENVFDKDMKNVDFNLINGGLSIAKSLNPEAQTTAGTPQLTPEGKVNVGLIVVIAVAVAAIAAAVIAMTVSKKKKSK